MAKRTFDLGAELRKAGGPTVDTREQIEYIPLELIDPDPENFYSLEGIDELAGSIELVGLQQPLRVREGERGHVTVVSGHRRRIACMMIRDGGSEMFKAGVPCIREKAAELPEMQELKLIFGNAQTRVMTAPEMSRQAVKTRDLLARLRDRGYDFPGRTRELVASVLQTSDSRVGRLTAIRERLVPELLKYFDGDRLGESVAYRLSQEDRKTQQIISLKLGPAVQDLTKETVEKVIEQEKKAGKMEETDCHTSAAALARNDGGPIVVHAEDIEDAPPVDQVLAEHPSKESNAIDELKKYLDGRADEDARFWKYMQEAADSLIQHSFAAGALPNRKDSIDMLRLDCRNASVAGYAADWEGSNKGITLQHLSRGGGISRTWTEVYDMLAAIAINRYRQAMVDEKARRNARPREGVPAVDTKPTWQTGPAPGPGRYLCRVDMDGSVHECTCEYREGGRWMAYGRTLDSSFKVIGWWPLPEK